MLDSTGLAALSSRPRPAVPAFEPPAQCASYPNIREIFSKMPWGGPRANSGGARPGAGRPRRQALTDPSPRDEPRWYVVRSLPDATTPRCGSTGGNQRLADIEIRVAGFQVFNPSVFKPAEAARRDRNGVIRPAKADRIEPLFPRFFFVRLNLANPAWHAIKDLPGVDHIMHGAGTPGLPVAVPDEVVLLVRNMCEPNDAIYPANHRHMNPIDVGTTLKLLTGGMEGHEGICTWSDGRRVKLLLSLLGRQVPITVSQSAVEVV